MSQLQPTLRDASDHNSRLLTELARTDYAPSSLTQNGSYISDLKHQIQQTDQELARLHQITEDERKDHVKYRDSNVKRWAYKMQGSKGKDKFSSKQEKEEREFQEAWQKERSAKEGRDELTNALQRAEQDRAQLETESQRHEQAQRELDALYQSIFSGPTPEVPGEDEREQALQQARANFESIQQQLRNDKAAYEALKQADAALRAACEDMNAALRRSTRDMWGGGTFTDMMERDALANSQNNVNGTLRHLSTAMRSQPAIQPLKEINIDQGHFFSDVMFDNIFTDMAQHDRIKSSQAQMHAAAEHLIQQIGEQKERVKRGEEEGKRAAEELEGLRRELQRIRSEAFAGMAGGAPPPAYGGGVVA